MDFMKSTQSCYRPNTAIGTVLPTLRSTTKDSFKGNLPPPLPQPRQMSGRREAFRLRTADTRMPPLKPATAMRSHTGFTPEQWSWANATNYKRSDNNRKYAETFRKDTLRLIQTKDQFTCKTQNESNKWICERIEDITFWSNEMRHEAEQLMRDSDMLRHIKLRLDRAIAETDGPLQVSQECLCQRQKRMGADIVNDEVEKELMQEVAVIKNCQEQLERVRDKVKRQLEANRLAQLKLEKDLNDKHVAFEIDSRCHKMTNCNSNIQFYPNLNKLDRSVSVPQTWARFSEDNITRSQNERVNTRMVMEEAERVMEGTSADMWSQFHCVNVAFTNRIAETTEAKNRLQYHLSRTLQEMFQTDRTIAELERTINDKKFPLKVAQSRLEERTKRPNMELCKDPPHNMLLSEVQHIQSTVSTLGHRLAEAMALLQQLADTKSVLEQELFVKAHSLFIDQERCMGLRKVFPSNPRLVGYT
ncbi:tektin-3-like [Sardina pilchardus]|uniref:tektin-3-like n=1 Tax=Sardina pilchardus TaxID=27697 RepID=UPI002E128DFB